MGQNADYFNKQINAILFLFSFEIIALKIDKQVMLSYLLLFDKRLEFDFFLNSIQNSHVHEPSKLVENLQHLQFTTKKNLTSNLCLTFCSHSMKASPAFAFEVSRLVAGT